MSVEKYIANVKLLRELIDEEFIATRKAIASESENLFRSDSIVAEFQSQDIIGQRIDHLIQGMLTFDQYFHDKKFKHAFLDLEYFQLMAIGRDLEKTITNIQNLAMQNCPEIEWSCHLFARRGDIRKLLKLSNRIFKRSNAHRLFIGQSPFDALQTDACFNLYTMHSERIVLKWFLSNGPFLTRAEFLKEYEHQVFITTSDPVELF